MTLWQGTRFIWWPWDLHKLKVGECMIECFNIGRNYTPYKSIQDFYNDSNKHGFYFLNVSYLTFE
jgi:hypothetical protein